MVLPEPVITGLLTGNSQPWCAASVGAERGIIAALAPRAGVAEPAEDQAISISLVTPP